MDTLQEIYIEDLPTGSRSEKPPHEEVFVPAQRPHLRSTENDLATGSTAVQGFAVARCRAQHPRAGRNRDVVSDTVLPRVCMKSELKTIH